MVFSSLVFLFAFLPACLVLYYILPFKAWRDGVLIAFSLAFYAWGEPLWVLLLVLSSAVDYANGLWIERWRGRKRARLAVIATLTFNLGILAAFKYSAFIAANLNLLGLSLPVVKNHLPIGISFYTFQTISYVIDVYRGEVPAQRNFWKFLLFVSLFHQLVAGPIVRYVHIASEIDHRRFNLDDFSTGISRFVVGLAKKVLLANTAGEVAASFLQGSEGSVAGAWWGILLFTLQIYFDFSGYSDMAIGLGQMFGFHYYENFNYPYVARSATDFWRRWHISLGTFFRDYVYIPLGGSRGGALRLSLNLLFVWFLTGLWHGASWNFILWGLFYGVLIMAEKLLLSLTGRSAPAPVAYLYMFLVTATGWTLFYYDEVSRAFLHLQAMAGLGGLPLYDTTVELSLKANVMFLLVALLACLPLWPAIRDRLHLTLRINAAPFASTALLTVSTVLLVGKTYNPFLYFRF